MKNPRLDVFGYFESWEQEIPAHDPGMNGMCLICGKTLEQPVKTISLMKRGDARSYFYRAHKGCYVNTSPEDISDLESSLIDAL